MVINSKKQSWDEYEERMVKDSKANQKLFFRVLVSLRKQKSGNTEQIKNKTHSDIERRGGNDGQMERIL